MNFALSSAKGRTVLLGLSTFQVLTLSVSALIVFAGVIGSHSSAVFCGYLLVSLVVSCLGLLTRENKPLIVSILIAIRFLSSKDTVRSQRVHKKNPRLLRRRDRPQGGKKRSIGVAYKVQTQRVDQGCLCLYDKRSAVASLGFALPKRSYLHASLEELEKISLRWGDFLSRCSDVMEPKLKTYTRIDIVPPWRCDSVDFEGLSSIDLWLQRDLLSQSWSTRSSFWLESNVKANTLGISPKIRSVSGEVKAKFSAIFDMTLGEPPLYVRGKKPSEQFNPSSDECQMLKSEDFSEYYQEVRVGALIYRCFEVARWPSGTLKAGALNPLFQPKPPARTVVLEATPLDRARSLRRAERERSEAIANKKMRQKAGYSEKLSYRVDEVELGRMESEVVDGHVLLSYRTIVVIFAPTLLELMISDRQLSSLASKIGVTLTSLDGLHLETLTGIEERTGVL